MRALLRATVLLGTVSLVVGLAAQSAAAAGSADELAQQLFREGVEAARQQRWLEARAAFERAYGLSRRPVVLINLAGAQARTGRLVEAARDYRRILDDHASAETAPFRKAAADVLPALEARIPRIRLRPTDLSAADVVEIDGVELSSARVAEAQPLDPGPHTLVVKRSGIERARVVFSLAERESHDISLPVSVRPAPAPGPPDLLGAQAALSAPVRVSLVASESTPVESPRRVWWRSPPVWLAVAGVLVAASVATIYAVERGDQTYTGNVPPGVISVK